MCVAEPLERDFSGIWPFEGHDMPAGLDQYNNQ